VNWGYIVGYAVPVVVLMFGVLIVSASLWRKKEDMK
jgi:hypothetical protein